MNQLRDHFRTTGLIAEGRGFYCRLAAALREATEEGHTADEILGAFAPEHPAEPDFTPIIALVLEDLTIEGLQSLTCPN